MAEYTLTQLVPIPPGGQQHLVEPVYVLGLATTMGPETAQVVSLSYDPLTGWVCNEVRAEYCGLIPPGWGLGRYEARDPHGHVPTPPGEDIASVTPP